MNNSDAGGGDGARAMVDRYRQAAYDLLHAATRLGELSAAISKTGQRVSPKAEDDLVAAHRILTGLPSVRTTIRTTIRLDTG